MPRELFLQQISKLDKDGNPYLALQIKEVSKDGTEKIHTEGDESFKEFEEMFKQMTLKDVISYQNK